MPEMKLGESSTVELSAEEVEEMCRETLKRIREARARARTQVIDGMRSRWERSWETRLRQAARRVLGRSPLKTPVDDYFLACMDPWDAMSLEVTYGNQEMTARRLLTACRYAGTIRVSVKDLDFIAS